MLTFKKMLGCLDLLSKEKCIKCSDYNSTSLFTF